MNSTMKQSLDGSFFFVVIVTVLLLLLLPIRMKKEYHVLDYDFYLRDGVLYAFVIEGEGVEKHNAINGKTYRCGKRVLVFKRNLEEPVPC